MSSSFSQCLHPLAPYLIKRIEVIQLSFKYRTAAAFPLGIFIYLKRHCQDHLLIKLDILEILRRIHCFKVYQRISFIQFIPNIPISIVFV